MITAIVVLSLLVIVLLAGYYKLYRRNRKLTLELYQAQKDWLELYKLKEEQHKEHMAHNRDMQILYDANRQLSKQVIEHNEQLNKTIDNIKKPHEN